MPRLNHGVSLFVSVAAALLLALPAGTAYGLSEEAVNALTLENHLEERLRSVLAKIIGPDRVIVLVSANAQGESGKRQDAVLLPGVPMKKEAGKDQDADFPAFKSSLSKLVVKKIAVTVLLDSGVSESVKETVRDVATSVLGLNRNRGDELFIRQIDFKNNRFAWSALFSPPNLYFFALSLAAGFFFVAAALFLLDPFKRLPAVLKTVDWDLVRGTGAARQGAGFADETRLFTAAAAETERGDGKKGAPMPFSFIEDRHLPALAFLLKESPARDVATVANYLGSELATKLFNVFSPEKQVEIALCLGAEDSNPERTRTLEETIKSRLDYVVGGEKRLASLLDMADDKVREKVLKQVEAKDANAANRLKEQMKDLEALLRELPQSAMPVLYRNLDPVIFAQVLKAQPDDVRARVAASLSPGAAERLQQEIDLSRPLSTERLKREQRKVTLAVRRMMGEGLIERENN